MVKLGSVVVTLALAGGAIAIGAGAPVSPARIAKVAGDATRNLAEAQVNIKEAVGSTEALARIERNVSSQLATSRRLLETQLDIERSSESGVDVSRRLVGRIEDVGDEVRSLVDRLRDVAGSSEDLSATARSSESAASELEATLDRLMERYEVAVRESRELNKKARAYEQVRP